MLHLKFDWVEFVKNGIFKDFPSIQIKNDEQILVNELDYLTNATIIYKNALATKAETLLNLMVWSFVKERTDFLPKIFKAIFINDILFTDDFLRNLFIISKFA